MARRVFFEEPGSGDAVYVLKRVADPKKAGSYTVERQFRYEDPGGADRRFVVPADTGTFVSDLASVPLVATWLVPKDGTHTPAALLHDALVGTDEEPANYVGPPVTRDEADLVFREAMRYLDVPLLRRWMMWAAVSLATLVTPGDGRRHRWWLGFIPLVVGALLLTGVVSVLDLVDIHRVRIPLVGWTISTELPWMGDRAASAELLGGVVAAAVAAVVSPALWLRRWRVGFMAALVVVPFAFPLVVATVAYLAYYLVETALFGVLTIVAGRQERDEPPVVPPKIFQRMA
jgi:hypothetical protein